MITHITPAATREIDAEALTDRGGGQIAIDPKTGESVEAYFVVRIALDAEKLTGIRYGMTGVVRTQGDSDPVGLFILRRLLTFINRLKSS